MNNSELQLYNSLSNLKNKLQNQASSNGHKKYICSDETIKLLAKYKPCTLQDMKNVSGIGEAFLNNYGDLFLEIINKSFSSEYIEIDDTNRTILNKLENRLVNINKKNKLLYCGKTSKDYIDLVKILSNTDELASYLISSSTKAFPLAQITVLEEDKYSQILGLMRLAKKIEVESGNNVIYIGYPFVQGKLEDEDFNIKAPLMLFPVKLEKINGNIILRNDESRDIIYNTNIILANNKFKGKNEVLPDNTVDSIDKYKYMENLINFYSDNKLQIQNKDCNIEKFLENKISEFPNYNNGQLEIKKYMVLGLFSTYVTSMYADFHKMINENNITMLIKELLSGIENSSNKIFPSTDDLHESIINSELETESTINYINELDYSQEKVLKELNYSNSLVVQGPPGTGKSQTITSIISQCILKGENVLMVSEKKTALDVIYSRLGDLSDYAIIIDDIEDKAEFFKQINSVIQSMTEKNSLIYSANESKEQIQNSIKEDISAINTDLLNLETIAKKIYGINKYKTSMYQIYKSCRRFNLSDKSEFSIISYINSILTVSIKNLDYPTLSRINNSLNENTLSNSLNNYLITISKNELFNNIKENLVDFDLIEFSNKLDEAENYCRYLSKISIFKRIFNRPKLNKQIKDILDKYFVKYNNRDLKYIIDNFQTIHCFLNDYREFVTDKSLYNNLHSEEKDYISLIKETEHHFSMSFKEANDIIYNVILFDIINEFEKNNPAVINYINNFDLIRNDIGQKIFEKKCLTKKLAYNKLRYASFNLDDNNRLSKIEELSNRSRKMAINKFMDRFKFELLDSVKIWLMTPEVVSDLLPFQKNLFDLVIFDEASQLYVEKAIPAIYRAKKVVVAGDNKQLKPSSLGTGRIIDEIDENEEYDGFLEYESLLDAAKYKYKQTMLNYHYRSKYDELISFSNYAFYNGKLMVISNSSSNKEKPIERIKVENGRWIGKKNEEEAKEVVKLIKNILNNRKHNETIGVITFNVSQMNLIDDLIDREKMNDSEFAAKMIAEENRESNGENISFFVKNIETVQGDERDIIIFCIGYAKNEKDRVAINFGWLSQDGGENRLNVAISRAKEKIYVITSIEPEELTVDSTKNNGPKLFKKYLEYVRALSNNDNNLAKSILLSLLDSNNSMDNLQQTAFDSEFEEEVYDKLTNQGYIVDTQYGVGGYRIDLVIKNKDGSNILGIECDGRLYHSSPYARERDYHRQKYLESRGWTIYRIWSSNWWKNPDLEIYKINKYVETIINKAKE